MLIKLVEVSQAGDTIIYAIPGSNALVSFTEEERAKLPNYDVVLQQYSQMLRGLQTGREPALVTGPTYAPPSKPAAPQAPVQAQQTAPQAPKESAPGTGLMSPDWLGENKERQALPFRVNDDAEPVNPLPESLALEISNTWDRLETRDKVKVARKLAKIKVQTRMKVKDLLPQQLKQMVVSISANKDGAKTSFIPASEAAFLGQEQPDFGLNKRTPLANIPEEFDEAALGKGPATEYRSVQELADMLKGD